MKKELLIKAGIAVGSSVVTTVGIAGYVKFLRKKGKAEITEKDILSAGAMVAGMMVGAVGAGVVGKNFYESAADKFDEELGEFGKEDFDDDDDDEI